MGMYGPVTCLFRWACNRPDNAQAHQRLINETTHDVPVMGWYRHVISEFQKLLDSLL